MVMKSRVSNRAVSEVKQSPHVAPTRANAPSVITRPAQPRIVLLAFNKHIADELKARLSGMGPMLKGSDEQEAIWTEIKDGTRHVMVQATAGSGKTATAIQACRLSGGQADAMTYHSLGYKALRNTFKVGAPDQWKNYKIMDQMKLPVAGHLEKMFKARVNKVVSLCKQYGIDGRADIERIVDHHDVELNGMEELVLEFVPQVLKRAMAMTSVIDFDDMIWLPHVLDLAVPRWDIVISDECQDLNIIQQKLATKAGDRHVMVGDKNQSIYGFRGADSKGMDSLLKMLQNDPSGRGVVEMPLTLTRRCPKFHVRMAQVLVPAIRAMVDAPEGTIRVLEAQKAVDEMKPGDMVLCRVNSELLVTAYRLLKKGVKAVVRGKDIGQGIVKLIEKAEYQIVNAPAMIPELVSVAGQITDQEVAKFLAIPNGRGEMRAASCQDKYDCLISMTDGCTNSAEVKRRIEQLFADFDTDGKPNNAVVLSTVHRGKGLEAGRVFILRPDLMPHPAARQEHEIKQELNLAYVAVTRAKFGPDGEGELIFVGSMCGLFGDAVQSVHKPERIPTLEQLRNQARSQQ